MNIHEYPWAQRAIEIQLNKARHDKDDLLKEIRFHQEQVDWRQAAVETLIEQIAELSALLGPREN